MDPRPIKILTLNLFLRPPLITTNSNDYKDERCHYFYKHILPHYDIICLQEVFEFLNNRKAAIIEAAVSRGFHYVSSPSPSFWRSARVIDGGLLIISRFPILESHFHSFHSGMFTDILADKGVLHAKIELHGHPVHFFTLHTQSHYQTENCAVALDYRLVRRGQLRETIEFVNKITQKGTDLVLCLGDFNVDSREGLKGLGDKNDYEALRSILVDNKGNHMLDFLKFKHNKHPATYGRTPANGETEEKALTDPECLRTDECLDYIFSWNLEESPFSVNWEATKVEPFFIKHRTFTQISDHTALQTELSLRNALRRQMRATGMLREYAHSTVSFEFTPIQGELPRFSHMKRLVIKDSSSNAIHIRKHGNSAKDLLMDRSGPIEGAKTPYRKLVGWTESMNSQMNAKKVVKMAATLLLRKPEARVKDTGITPRPWSP